MASSSTPAPAAATAPATSSTPSSSGSSSRRWADYSDDEDDDFPPRSYCEVLRSGSPPSPPAVVAPSPVAQSGITMDLDILDCPVCFLPLRPPVFQCTVGHTICSSCHDKLPDKCHFCSLPTVYNRCHMVEHVIESIKVACSNGNHGCTARITYYQREEHEKGCPHAPCFCPEAGCSFSGPTVRLLDHFSSKHKLHSPKVMYNKAFRIRIRVGSTILVGEDGCLFLVNMIPEALGGVMSVCCVQPHSTGSKFKCKLSLTSTEPHCSQVMEFVTRSSNLYDGLPKDCLPFLVPRVLLRGDGTSATAMVGVVLMPQ